ncbi:hypothetical protein MMC25_008131 [Agyrium rufum]|nr:hypothetical protein [Agyrium rufum]
MTLRGQRFNINLDSEYEEAIASYASNRQHGPKENAAPGGAFINDIVERPTTLNTQAPSPPKLKAAETGFPAHKKRTRESAFKRQQQHANSSATVPTTEQHADGRRIPHAISREGLEKQEIDEENSKRLAEMSPAEIEAERQELLESLGHSTIERLLRRAKFDDGSAASFDQAPSQPPRDLNHDLDGERDMKEPKTSPVSSSKPSKKVTFSTTDPQDRGDHTLPSRSDDDEYTASRNSNNNPNSTTSPPPPSIHFPRPPSPPPLDPSSPDFLANLREKYFPTFAPNPSTLAWAAPLPTPDSIADQQSPYNPSQTHLAPQSLRFDFQGLLLPPHLARQIPVTKGLHHHGEAPEAAGYTIPELARLARSKVMSQRCVAVQTLGRVLWRLGEGQFGSDFDDSNDDRKGARSKKDDEKREQKGIIIDEDGRVITEGEDDAEEGQWVDGGKELCRGLWTCMDDGKVIDILLREAGKEDGPGTYRTLKVLAMEAVWLWRRSGGRRGLKDEEWRREKKLEREKARKAGLVM